MNNINAGRKTWAKPNQKGPFGNDRLDLLFASEPESPKSPPSKDQVFEDALISPGFKSPSMNSFLDRRFTFGHGDGEGDENSVVSSSNVAVQMEGEDSGSNPKTSPRQTWDIFIHETPKSDTKAVRNIIQAWREKEIKSFNNLSDSGGNNAQASSSQSKSSLLSDARKSKSSLPYKRTLSSSIDQLNNIFDAMQGDSSESDSQDGINPQRGSLGYFRACATPQMNRKFPQTKKTVTFVDHKSGKVTPTRRRDRSSDGGQRSKFFDTPPRARTSQPVVHPMFKPATRSGSETSPDDLDLNDSIDSGVVVQEVSKAPARKPFKALAIPLTEGSYKLNATQRSPPPVSLGDDDKVDATSNPFKNVLKQWQSNQKNQNLSKEVKMKNKANEKDLPAGGHDDTISKDNNHVIEIDKPDRFIYSPSQLKSHGDNTNGDGAMFTFNQNDKDSVNNNKARGMKSHLEVSPTLLDQFPTKLNETPFKDIKMQTQVEKPIDEDLDLPSAQVLEKISMFEVKRPPKQFSQSPIKANRARQLPKPPVVKVNDSRVEADSKRVSLSEQFRHKGGRGRSESPLLLSSTSCTDIYRECNSPQTVAAPDYETRSLSRSRPKLRSNAPKADTNRARSKTPNFPRSSGDIQTIPSKQTSGANTKSGVRVKAGTDSPETKSPKTSPRSNSASLVASIVSKINKQRPDSKPDQSNVSSANRFRSSSSSAILTAPIPFSKAKPPVSPVSPPVNTQLSQARAKPSSNSSMSGTAASKISKNRRKMPELPDSPASSPRSNSSGRKTPEPTVTSKAVTPNAVPATSEATPTGRLTPTAAMQFAGGRRTPEYFLQQRHIATENARGVPDVAATGDVFRGHAHSSVDMGILPTTNNVVISGSKRQLPSVAAAASRGRKTPDMEGKPPLQRSSSGRAFPNSGLFERRSEVTQKRADKQKSIAQRLGGRILPSAPSVVNNRPHAGGSDRDISEGQASPLRRALRSPSPSSRHGVTSSRQRVTSPSPSQPRSAAASPAPGRSRERARSPWQMMLAGGKLNQPKQSMTSLGRSITRSLTPNRELLDMIEHDVSDTEEPYVPLLRGRSEPNLVTIFNAPLSPTDSDLSGEMSKPGDDEQTRIRSHTQRRGSASNRLEGEDSEISEAFTAKQSRRKQVPRERRRTVGSVPTMVEIERSASPAPRLGGTSVSERFLRLSQGDLSAPPDTLDELMRNPPKHRGVRRSSSLRDFRNPRTNQSLWSGDVTGNTRHDNHDQGQGKPVKVYRDDQNGLVGYVFNV